MTEEELLLRHNAAIRSLTDEQMWAAENLVMVALAVSLSGMTISEEQALSSLLTIQAETGLHLEAFEDLGPPRRLN